MISDVEIAMRQRQTMEFIEAEPFDLVLSRRALVPDGAGGYKRGPAVALAVQRLRLVTPNAQLPVRSSADGRDVSPVYTLVGMPTADVKMGDVFTLDATRYEIVFVQPNKIEALRAEVAYGR